jgi:hypothetical protein
LEIVGFVLEIGFLIKWRCLGTVISLDFQAGLLVRTDGRKVVRTDGCKDGMLFRTDVRM